MGDFLDCLNCYESGCYNPQVQALDYKRVEKSNSVLSRSSLSALVSGCDRSFKLLTLCLPHTNGLADCKLK